MGRALRNLALALVVSLVSPSAEAYSYRSLTSRARADLRSMATALESYFIDHGAYPPVSGGAEFRLDVHWLTTPLAYLTSPFDDPHKIRVPHQPGSIEKFLRMHSEEFVTAPLVMAMIMLILRGTRASKRIPLGVAMGLTLIGGIMAWGLISFLKPELYETIRWHRLQSRPNTAWTSEYTGFNYHVQPITDDDLPVWILQGVGDDGVRTLEALDSLAGEEGVTHRELEQALLPYTYDPTNGSSSAGDIFRIHQ